MPSKERLLLLLVSGAMGDASGTLATRLLHSTMRRGISVGLWVCDSQFERQVRTLRPQAIAGSTSAHPVNSTDPSTALTDTRCVACGMHGPHRAAVASLSWSANSQDRGTRPVTKPSQTVQIRTSIRQNNFIAVERAAGRAVPDDSGCRCVRHRAERSAAQVARPPGKQSGSALLLTRPCGARGCLRR